MNDFIAKNGKGLLILAIVGFIVWFFFLKKKQSNSLIGQRANYPNRMYNNQGNIMYVPTTVVPSRGQEKSALTVISSILSQLNAQFNSTGCSSNNVNNSNAAINELRMQSNVVQDLNMRQALNTFLMTYPNLITDCSLQGISNKGGMIATLQTQVATYNSTIV